MLLSSKISPKARTLDAALTPLYELLALEPNPIPLKWCTHLLGFGDPEPRLPLLPLSVPYRERANSVLAALGLAVQPRHSHAA